MPSQLESLLQPTIIVADAGAALISPFVGCIRDGLRTWAGAGRDDAANAGLNDPGLRSVRAALNRLKGSGDSTEIVGAPVCGTEQTTAPTGGSPLTTRPGLLVVPAMPQWSLPRALPSRVAVCPRKPPSAPALRRAPSDGMETGKPGAGIRLPTTDTVKLERVKSDVRECRHAAIA